MRNPARKALYYLLALLAAAALIRLGIGREQRIGEHWTEIVPILVGLGIAPFALVFLIQALFAVRGQSRLLRGEGVIARWQVYPGEWEQFRGLDSRRSAARLGLGNDLWVRKRNPMDPVQVIVGRKSALVDGSYHSLNPRGLPELRGVNWLEGPPTCLEFSLVYPRGRHGGTVRTTLRIPVPPSARPDARRVVAHFEPLTLRTPSIALRNPPRTLRVCVLLILGGGVAYAAGHGLADSSGGSGDLVAISLMIGGIITALFASILALATWLLTRLDMKIRAAGISDIEAMHALRLRVRENALSDPRRVTEKDYPPYLGRNSAWVGETGPGLAGFAILDVDGGRIWALFVAPEAEGKGIGRALHARLIEAAVGHGLRRLVLDTAPGTRAERFYAELGWTRTGTTPTGELSFERNPFS